MTVLPPLAASDSAPGDKPASLTPQPAPESAPSDATGDPKVDSLFWDFPRLKANVPLGERGLRDAIKRNWIPCIRLPGGRRLLFDPASVRAALLRMQTANRS